MTLPALITVSQLRGFRREAELRLAPITVLYGPNNVGKSALLRLVPLIAEAAEAGSPPGLPLSGAAGRGSRFADLLWSGDRASDEPPRLGLGLHWSDDSLRSCRWEFSPSDSGLDAILREVEVEVAATGQNRRWSASLVDQTTRGPQFMVRDPQGTRMVALAADGLRLLASPESDPICADLRALTGKLDSMRNAVQWLTAPRRLFDGTTRIVPEPSAAILRSRDRGPFPPDGGPTVLQRLRADPELCAAVSGWFRERATDVGPTGGAAREIGFEPVAGGYFQPWMRALRGGPRQVHLMDAGAGWIQLLPVLTALAEATRAPGPRLLAVEEPEANLHPDAQVLLASSAIDTIRLRPDVRIVVETHAQSFLQYLQLAILKGDLTDEQVAIGWVSQNDGAESGVQWAAFDAEARLSEAWPSGAFTSGLTLARQIDARRRRVLT